MAVCTFFLRGNCKYGERCHNEHPRSASAGPSPFGANRFSSLSNAGRAPSNSPANAPAFHINKDEIKKDLTAERPQWPLSCYGPGRDAPRQLIEGPVEISQEELRVRYYTLKVAGNEAAAADEQTKLLARMQEQVESILKDMDGAVRYIEEGANMPNNRTDIAKGTVVFGAPSGSGATNSPSPFARPATNAFGGAAQAQPAFGQPTAPASAFASSRPAFAQATAPGQVPSPFGQPSNPGQNASPFARASSLGQSTSAFGQPSNPGQTTSAFGQPSNPAQNASPFGRPATLGQAAPAFGQPSNPAQNPSPFAQRPSGLGQATSAFGQPSNPAQTVSPFAQRPSGLGSGTSPFAQASNPGQGASPFGQPSKPGQTASPFAQAAKAVQGASPFGQPSAIGGGSSAFGNPSASAVSPFGQPSGIVQQASPFAQQQVQPQRPAASPFAAQQTLAQQPKPSPFAPQQTQSQQSTTSPFAQAQQQASSPFAQAVKQPTTAAKLNPFAQVPAASASQGRTPSSIEPPANSAQSKDRSKDKFKEGSSEEYEGELGDRLRMLYLQVIDQGAFPDDQDIPYTPPKVAWIVPVAPL